MNPLWLALACAHTPEAPVLDLSQAPAVPAAPNYTPPTPTEHKLSNGIKVWVVERPGLPLISLRMVFPGGSAADPKGAWGTSSLADEMLNQGAGDLDATAFARAVEQLALSIDANTTDSSTVVYMDSQSKTLDAGLSLLSDLVLRPRFEQSDLDRVKEIRIGQLTEATDDAKTVAGWVMDREYFGADHPLGHPVGGTLRSIAEMKLDHIKDSWASRIVPDHASIVVAGDVNTAELLTQLEEKFGQWKSAGNQAVQVPPPPLHAGDGRFFFVNKVGTSQTALQVMMPAPKGDDPSAEPAELGAIVLGGTFTSRLNRKLREEMGYTYGARASYSGKPDYGYLWARTNVQREVSAPALVELIAQLNGYQDGIDEVELGKARSAWQTRAVESMESRAAIAGSFASLTVYGLPATTLSDELNRAKAATIQTVHEAIGHSKMDNAIVVVVGDLEKIQADIEAAVPADWAVVTITE
jgi:predicted Zn-dependent peptidase